MVAQQSLSVLIGKIAIVETPGHNLEHMGAMVPVLFHNELTRFLGSWVNSEVILGIRWYELLLCLLFLALVFVVERVCRTAIQAVLHRTAAREAEIAEWVGIVLRALTGPLSLLIWSMGVFGALEPMILRFEKVTGIQSANNVAGKIVYCLAMLSIAWFMIRLLAVMNAHFKRLAERSGKVSDRIMADLLDYWRTPLRLLIMLIYFRSIYPVLSGPPIMFSILGYAFALLIVACIAWWIISTTNIMEDYVLRHYKIGAADDLHARKVHTQIRYLRKIVIIAVVVVAAGSMLMVFPMVRKFGASLLASAGIAGVIAGLAVQRSLTNLLVGMQIAITQPIRVEDVVVVENEWGWIEEITSTYVVVRIWDLRRLILPISYFAEKPFQNWTRTSAGLLGTVFLYVDYSVPVDVLRQELQAVLQKSKLWDRQAWGLQVTDATEKSMQIRCLMSAANSPDAWNLRCEVREKMIDFIQANYPGSLPRIRAEVVSGGFSAIAAPPEKKDREPG
jgi:small-conductance mechanosensitive channel